MAAIAGAAANAATDEDGEDWDGEGGEGGARAQDASALSRTEPRPVVAIDFDGVLNRLANSGDEARALGGGWQAHTVVARAVDLPESPFIRDFGDRDLTLPVVINPGLHGAWITALRRRADVVWATLWENAANVVLAPLLGIEPLPVGVSVAVHKPRPGDAIDGDIGGWKAYALAEAFEGRPLAWLDDMTGSYANGWFSRVGQPTLVVPCDPATGLAPEQMVEVDAWVDGLRRG